MTEKELLGYAAKAAGVNLVCKPLIIDGELKDCWFNQFEDGKIGSWEPHNNDGDAFRLAVKLQIHLEFAETCVIPSTDKWAFSSIPFGDDPCSAARQAVVEVAAQLGMLLND